MIVLNNTLKLSSIEDIQKVEVKSEQCSDKYVPIKTTDCIKELSSFSFEYGSKYSRYSSAHYVELSKNSDVKLRIENSFDRSIALRISFMYKGFNFGRIKQIHRGESAVELKESFKLVDSWYNNSLNVIDTLKSIKFDIGEMEAIAHVAFKTRGVRRNDITNLSFKHESALDFILYLIDGIKDGIFCKVFKNSHKQVKPVTREIVMVNINYRIWKTIRDTFPEYYI